MQGSLTYEMCAGWVVFVGWQGNKTRSLSGMPCNREISSALWCFLTYIVSANVVILANMQRLLSLKVFFMLKSARIRNIVKFGRCPDFFWSSLFDSREGCLIFGKNCCGQVYFIGHRLLLIEKLWDVYIYVSACGYRSYDR